MSCIIINAHPALAGRGANGERRLIDVLAEVNDGFVITDTHLLANVDEPGRVVVKLLPEATSQPVIRPRLVINHSNAGEETADLIDLFMFRDRPDVKAEAHLQIQTNGLIGQFMPFNRRAACNGDANLWYHNGVAFGAVAHSTQDSGSNNVPIDREPWTVAQLDALVGATTAECAVYHIRCHQPAVWNDSGIGHHSLFPHLGPGVTGSWMDTTGQVCPGKARIAQMDFIRHAVAQRLGHFYAHCGASCP